MWPEALPIRRIGPSISSSSSSIRWCFPAVGSSTIMLHSGTVPRSTTMA